MTLLHEEFARFRRQLLADELIFRVGEGEPVNIVATRTLWIGKHNLGRDLFEDRVGSSALERVRRRLRGKSIGRAPCRERVCQYVEITVVAEFLQKNNNV